MEISLPDEHGRYQILNIHTTRMKEFKKIADDVDMKVFSLNYYNQIKIACLILKMFRNFQREQKTLVVLSWKV